MIDPLTLDETNVLIIINLRKWVYDKIPFYEKSLYFIPLLIYRLFNKVSPWPTVDRDVFARSDKSINFCLTWESSDLRFNSFGENLVSL